MKKPLHSLSAIFVLSLGATLAHADGEKCDSPMHNQASGLNPIFSSADTDMDGTVSKSEFDAYYAKHNEKHFMEVDTNKDGKLTPDEMQGSQPPQAVTGTTHLDRRFYAADVNHDGGLNHDESKNMPMLLQYFKEVDTNNDGKVTRQEYFDAMPLLHSGKHLSAGGKTQQL